MSLPDFLIIGAMKCGTSTLAAQLGAQDGVFLSDPKEPNFFSDDAIYAKGREWYEQLFEGAAPTNLKGEASTHYTKLPTYPRTVERMCDMIPALRLVYMVRNPIDRAVSHFIHEWTEGRMDNDVTTAFKNHPELVEYGLYAKQLKPFLETYGRESICVTSLERWRANPQAELSRIGAHIGVTEDIIWQADLAAKNVSAERIRKFPLYGLLVGNPFATAVRRALVPKSLRNRIRQASTYGARPELPEMLRVHLAETFASDQAQLSALFPDVDLFPSVTSSAEPN